MNYASQLPPDTQQIRARVLASRHATLDDPGSGAGGGNSAEVQTAPLPFPLDGVQPWSELSPQAALPSAEPFALPLDVASRQSTYDAPSALAGGNLILLSDFLLACTVWTALILLVTWVYLSAQWLGLL